MQPTWFGFRPSKSPQSLDLVELSDTAVVLKVIGSVNLQSGEYAWPNAVRCLPGPPAFCLFATTQVNGVGAAGNESFVYRVSTADASVVYKQPCPGVCNQMHVDYTSGTAYTFSFEGPGGTRAEVISVTAAGPVQVANITAAVAGGAVRPGQTTHCSATNHMYVGVDHGGGESRFWCYGLLTLVTFSYSVSLLAMQPARTRFLRLTLPRVLSTTWLL